MLNSPSLCISKSKPRGIVEAGGREILMSKLLGFIDGSRVAVKANVCGAFTQTLQVVMYTLKKLHEDTKLVWI